MEIGCSFILFIFLAGSSSGSAPAVRDVRIPVPYAGTRVGMCTIYSTLYIFFNIRITILDHVYLYLEPTDDKAPFMGEFDLDKELEKDLEKLLRRGRAPALDEDDNGGFDNTSTTAIVGLHPDIIEQLSILFK